MNFDLDRVKMNQHAKYLGQKSKRYCPDTQTHTPSSPIALPGPLNLFIVFYVIIFLSVISANKDEYSGCQ